MIYIFLNLYDNNFLNYDLFYNQIKIEIIYIYHVNMFYFNEKKYTAITVAVVLLFFN